MKLFSRNTKAFTLVELMVTLLIAGILAAVAIPMYSNYIRKASLAEGYAGLDSLVKAEVAYFLIKREFVILSQNPATIPSPAKQEFTQPADWARLGTLFPTGSSVQFSFGSFAGRTDGNFAEIDLINSGTHSSVSDSWSPSSGSLTCTPAVALEDFVSVNGKPQYNWVFVYAVANLKDDSNPSEAKCTQLMKLVDTNPRGDLVTGNAVASQNVGE